MKRSTIHRNGERAPGPAVLRRLRERGEEGQALVIVLIAILLMTLLIPVVVADATSEATNSSHGVDFEAALAAAEAGVQQYRNYLDVDSNYWRFNSSNTDGDPALAQGGWQPIAGSSPPEWFHYLPNNQFLPKGSGTVTPAVLLTVTGRAGSSGNYSYRTLQVTFQTTGLLTDAYFSVYETLDPQQDTAEATVTVGTGGSATSTLTTPNLVSLPAPVPDNSSTTSNLWQALCEYEDWQPNDFIDSLGISNPYKAGNTYSATYPYYGPWRGNDPTTNSGNTFTYTTGSGQNQWSVSVADPCGPVYNFVGGENFGGPVYTDDQLWLCNPGGSGGSGPNFADGIEVGDMPEDGFPYAYPQWPAQPSSTSPGWIDDGPLDWDQSCGGGGASRDYSFGTQGVRGVPQVAPENVDTALLQQAQVNGCVYTGPTMIEFTGGGSFNVWSPESTATTTGYGTSAGQCGTFTFSATDAAGAFVTGLTIPSSGLLIYVNNQSSSAPLPTTAQVNALVSAGVLPTSATCINPWKPYAPSSVCNSGISTEGDAVVEGEVEGQVTVGTEDNIIVSRDVTYECADNSGSGGVSQQQSSSYVLPSGCFTEAVPDVLGLVANGDVVIGKPGIIMNGTCDTEASGGGCSPTTPPVGSGTSGSEADDQIPTQTEPYEWPAINPPGSTTSQFCGQQGVGTQDGTESPQTTADVVPDCEIQNPVIDAAMVALGGSLADEDWDIGPSNAGGAWVQGTDISFTRGPFGQTSSDPSDDTGYSKEFSYDGRLEYLTPPDIDLVAGLTWNPSDWVACGTVNDVNVTNPAAAGICPVISGINN